MIFSIFFLLSGFFLFGMLLLFPKTGRKLPLLTWCASAFLLMECYASAVGGVLTAVNLPADKITIGIANLLLGLALLFRMRVRKARQKLYLDVGTIPAIVVCLLAVVVVAVLRFTPQLYINFETSDPAIHFKLAMDSLNLHSTMGYGAFMYVGQFTNALFLSIFQPFVAANQLYHIFILRLLWNWMMAGAMFYSCIAAYAKNGLARLLAVGCMLVYFCGYPLTDLLFGFVYLGQTLNFILLLIFLSEQLAAENLPLRLAIPAYSVACLAVSLGYILFAPAVYIALFVSLAVGLCSRGGRLISWKHIRLQLSVFLFPTVMTLLYYFVLIRRFDQSASITSLMVDGYIYRNFYSDFVLFIPLALWGIFQFWKKGKDRFAFYLALLVSLFMAGMLLLVSLGLISGYYYYKMNFLFWLLLLFFAAQGLLELEKNVRSLAVCLSLSFCIFAALFLGQAEVRLQNSGVQVTPTEYTVSETWFRNYSYNRDLLSRKNFYDEGKIQLYQQMNFEVAEDITQSKETLFLGSWTDAYWCQALSGARRMDNTIAMQQDAVSRIEQKLDTMEQGGYILLLRDSCEDEALLGDVQELLEQRTSLLFSNESGWLYEVR